MPVTLHPHLKRGLDFDNLYATTSGDFDDGLSPTHYDLEAREAKRRRVEAIALRYLQGKTPLIISAGLKGPFGKGWKNPWASKTRKSGRCATAEVDCLNVGSVQEAQKIRNGSVPTKSKVQAKRNAKPVSLSPEAPRAAHSDPKINEEEESLSEVEVMPSTAPSQQRIGCSTENGYTQPEPRVTNPFWLHRAKSPGQNNARRKIGSYSDISPTRARSRDGEDQPDFKQGLQLSFPKPLLGYQNTSPKSVILDDLKSDSNPPTVRASRHDHAASPAPTSSTSFVYRKFSRSKRMSKNTSNLKSEHLKSSPVRKTNTPSMEKQIQNEKDIIQNLEPSEVTSTATLSAGQTADSIHHDIDRANGSTLQDDQGGLASNLPFRSSQQSAFSTQAALLLAQAQFQEFSSSPTHSQIERPWSQYEQHTSQSALPEPSPPITPLPGFSTQLDNALAHTSVLRASPINTQDLLGAVSPFTFSTAKKKVVRSSRKSLRLSLYPDHDDLLRTNKLPGTSATPSTNRVPLKTKNTSTSLWSFTSDKASQESSANRLGQARCDAALSPPDGSILLDRRSPDGGLHFTDRLLCRLEDI